MVYVPAIVRQGVMGRRPVAAFNPLTGLEALRIYSVTDGVAAGGALVALDANPGTLQGVAPPDWVLQAGRRALRFHHTGAISCLTWPDYTFVAGTNGVGAVGVGGGAIGWWQYLPAATVLGSYDTVVVGRADGNADVYLDHFGGVDCWNCFGVTGSDHRSSVAPTRDAWTYYLFQLHADSRAELWQGPTRVVAYTWGSNWVFNTAGGVPGAGTYNPDDLYLAQVEIFPRALSPLEHATKRTGGNIELRPVRAYLLDELSGTTAHDGALTPAVGGSISSLANLANGARPLVYDGTAGHRPIYAVRGVGLPVLGGDAPPLDGNPPIVDGVARFDTVDDQLADDGTLAADSPVTALTIVALGAVHDFHRGNTTGTFEGVRRNLLGLSHDNTFDPTNGSASEYALLRTQLGKAPPSAGQPAVHPAFEAVIKKAGGNEIVLRGTPLDTFLRDIGVRFQGSTRVSLLQGGQEVAFTTVGVPANLALEAKFSVPAGSAWDGYELKRLAVGAAAWSDVKLGQLHDTWSREFAIPDVFHGMLKDGGGWDAVNRHGYAIGFILWVDPVTGRRHVFISAGPSDPGIQDTLYLTSQDGRTWDDRGVFATSSPTDDLAWTAFGSSVVQLTLGANAGRVMIYGGTNPSTTPFTPWLPYRWRCDAPNAEPPVWVREIVNTDGTLTGYEYWFIHGRIREVGTNHLRGTGYGLRTGDANIGSFIIDSTDGGLTWTVHRHLPSAAGATGLFTVEPTSGHDPVDPNKGYCYCRVAQTGVVFKTEDDWATVTYPTHYGDNATMPTHVEVDLYPCHDVPGDYLLAEGIRGVLHDGFDAVERYGVVVGRVRDGRVGRRRLVAPMAFGQSAYSSLAYIGVVNERHRIAGAYGGDEVNTYYFEASEEDFPWIPN